MFWEYLEVSQFWQIERETLEVWQIFARLHYFHSAQEAESPVESAATLGS